MALHTETKIYKHAYQLLNLSITAKANMRRDFKNSLGTRIHDECIEVHWTEMRELTLEVLCRIEHPERTASPASRAQAICWRLQRLQELLALATAHDVTA